MKALRREDILIGLKHFFDEFTQPSTRFIAIDLETTGLDPQAAEVTWMSWSTENKYGAIPILHRKPMSARANRAEVVVALNYLLARNDITVIWHNGVFDLSVLVARGWIKTDEIKAKMFDTLLASYILNPVKRNEGGRHGLKELYREHKSESEFDQPAYEEVCGQQLFEDVELEAAAWYATFDAWATYKLFEIFKAKLKSEPLLNRYFHEIEMPHLLTTVDICCNGMHVISQAEIPARRELLPKDKQTHFKTIREWRDELDATLKRVFELTGKSFKFTSPNDLRRALFKSTAGLSPLGRGKKSKKYAIDQITLANILETASGMRAKKIIAYVLASKRLLEIIKKHEEIYDSVTSELKIYPKLRSTTSSGRYAARRPNVLAFSRASNIKAHLVAPESQSLVVGDFSQIDLRVIANETGAVNLESEMLRIVNDGVDLHFNTLAIVDKEARSRNLKKLKEKFRIPRDGNQKIENLPQDKEWVDALMKKRDNLAKRINFGISYGLGPTSLLSDLNNSAKFRETIMTLPTIERSAAPGGGEYERLLSESKWYQQIKVELQRQKHTIADVHKYLEDFHAEYPEIRTFQEAIERDLQLSGFTTNIFGRRSRAELVPTILDREGFVFDLCSVEKRWFRVKMRGSLFSKAGIYGLIETINELDTQTSPESQSLNAPSMVAAGKEIYKADVALIERVISILLSGEIDPFEARREIEEIHEQALRGAADFFEEIKPAAINNDSADQFAPRSFPFVIIPHNAIKQVFVGGNAVTYPGYDRLRRKLISYRVSSTSMDFCKIAMTEFRRAARQRWPEEKRPRIVNCIHDEIAILCPSEHAEEVRSLLGECMSSPTLFEPYLADGRKLLVQISGEVSQPAESYGQAKS